jgi:Flp pilus assembly protein TadG
MVEFAIVLPLLLMLIFGIYQFGRGYNAKVELTGAVREGARAAALGKTAAEVQNAVTAASPGLTPAPAATVLTACTGTNPNAVVRATYNVSYTIPFFRTGTWTLSVQGVMRCGL